MDIFWGWGYFQAFETMKVLMANKKSSEFKGHHSEDGRWYRWETWNRSAGKHCTLCKFQSSVPGTSDGYLCDVKPVSAHTKVQVEIGLQKGNHKKGRFSIHTSAPLFVEFSQTVSASIFSLWYDWTTMCSSCPIRGVYEQSTLLPPYRPST